MLKILEVFLKISIKHILLHMRKIIYIYIYIYIYIVRGIWKIQGIMTKVTNLPSCIQSTMTKVMHLNQYFHIS